MRRARIPFSAEEMRWLEANRTMIISDYHKAFCKEFSRTDVIAAHLHNLRKRKGWKVGRAPGRFAGRRLRYSDAEITWLKRNSAMEINAYCAAFREAFARLDATPAKLHSLRKREGWKTGRTGQFAKGAVPWSKGKKLPFNAGRARTHFKKGEQPHNTKYAGHERIAVSGYIEISVHETNPHTGADRRYVLKHRWLWERAHGPIPPGHVLKCKGDPLNTDPENWELVPRALLPRLNGRYGRGYDDAPAEIKPAIMAVAKLEHRVREKSKARS